jgi:hypothetical protein
MRSFVNKTTTVPAAFKTIRYGCRFQLWGRQASIVIGLNTLAFGHAPEDKRSEPKKGGG